MIRIYNTNEISEQEILLRNEEQSNVAHKVAEIIGSVHDDGDSALIKYTEEFDGVKLKRLEVSDSEWKRAVKEIEPEFIEILKEAAENIRQYHSRQKNNGYIVSEKDGVILGRKVTPLKRAGLYIPGGTASYPSSVLMNCIPAKIAGVPEIIIATPPEKNGAVNSGILAAAKVAGADRVFKCGGAQAVAALAYGTQSVPKVDKIVGPGNIFVAEAKKQVYGTVDIDMIAGPSEILIISDDKSNPEVLAADMLSQAEHDRLATAVLVTTSSKLAERVAQELEIQLRDLPREAIARESIEKNGKIIVADSMDRAVEISNKIAPEHLELCVDEPFEYLNQIDNAGSIFLGRNCPEALGDYFAGTNHTLPTGGRARFSSPLSVEDFVKTSSYIYYSAAALARDAGKIAYFAEKEGLSGHARSAMIRSEMEKDVGK